MTIEPSKYISLELLYQIRADHYICKSGIEFCQWYTDFLISEKELIKAEEKLKQWENEAA